jgi:hypothetical protein
VKVAIDEGNFAGGKWAKVKIKYSNFLEKTFS